MIRFFNPTIRAIRALICWLPLPRRNPCAPIGLIIIRTYKAYVVGALLNDPDILLCDEPTVNLDSKTGAGIMDLMTKLNKKRYHHHHGYA